jgi:hypothetical protein
LTPPPAIAALRQRNFTSAPPATTGRRMQD